jgi:hypothetical protein
VYSSKNENKDFVTAEPRRQPDGSYDLTDPAVLRTIIDRSVWTDKSNFDFFTYSEPGDPWYDAKLPWIHADGGGKEEMNLMAADVKAIVREADERCNESHFDRHFFFVAQERQFPKPRQDRDSIR